jgi:hypothetical protein
VGHQLYGGELMAYEYGGRYYPTLSAQRNAMARDKYTPQQMQIAQTIAYQQLPNHLKGRHSQMRVQQNLAATAEALFGGQQKQQSAPAPAPAPAPSAPSPSQQLQIASLTKESEAYRAEAEKTIAEGQARVAELENEELQRQRATELQNRLAIQAQQSQARGMSTASLQISPASQTSRTAGTQAFKRRTDPVTLSPIRSTTGINVPTSSVLNI